jgi:hypothetical protein
MLFTISIHTSLLFLNPGRSGKPQERLTSKCACYLRVSPEIQMRFMQAALLPIPLTAVMTHPRVSLSSTMSVFL